MDKMKDKLLREAIATDREQAQNQTADIFTDRVSIKELRNIWNDRNHQYTDDELYQIRDWLYVIAGAVVHTLENNTPATLASIRSTKTKKRINKNALVFVHKAKTAS